MTGCKHLHFKMYKPFGVLSQLATNDNNQRKKKFLGDFCDFPNGIMPIGRLDEKSEGLLLLTTDGKLSDTINSAGSEKEYYVQLDGLITASAIEKLEQGINIGIHGRVYTTKPCSVHSIPEPTQLPTADAKIRIGRHRPNSWISICVTEGKFRQIRKMTAAVGYPTLRLVRVRISDITLDELSPGSVKAVEL